MPTLIEKALSVKWRKEILGASCRGYIRLTPKYSLKLFGNKAERDDSFIRQKAAHALNFAPKALVKIDKGRSFGYITEHANTEKPLTNKQMRSLKAKMRKQGWSVVDVEHDVNVGLINNKPVLIDFDSCTLGEYIYECNKYNV